MRIVTSFDVFTSRLVILWSTLALLAAPSGCSTSGSSKEERDASFEDVGEGSVDAASARDAGTRDAAVEEADSSVVPVDKPVPGEPQSKADAGAPGERPGAFPAIGASCSTPLEKACSGHNTTNKLVCLAGKWTYNGTCDGLSRCDTRAGASQGTCQGVAIDCLDLMPGDTSCSTDKTTVLTCGADLLDSTKTVCAANSHCAGRGDASCVCDHGSDGLGGCVVLAGRYWDNGNGTLFDPDRKLTWQRSPDTSPDAGRTWDEANAYCAGLTLSSPRSVAAWRVPLEQELATIVDTTKGAPTLDRDAFPNTPSTSFWAGDPSDPDNANAAGRLAIRFSDGLVEHTLLSRRLLVRCVR